jgi:penicillin-binding protein 1A
MILEHQIASRQVGSTFKPLLYTLAVTDAGYNPETQIAGGPLTLGGKTISTGGGSMAYCLAKSLNGAAWHLMALVGVKRTIEFAQLCGIKTAIPPYPSIALGAAEIPLLEMLRAYTMFPNKGMNTEPIIITRIEDKDGNLLQDFTAETKQVINENDAYTMVKMMEGVVDFGTARSLANYNIPVKKAGKTGTTQDNTDGWYMGYTPELLAGTWVGCDDPFIRIYAGTSGGNEMALPKWGYFMNKVYNDRSLGYGTLADFEQPAQMANNPIYADQNFKRIATQGDSSVYPEDQGNGAAGDFVDPATTGADIPLESQFNAPRKDTGTKNKIKPEALPVNPKKTEDPKGGKAILPPAAVEDKNKKAPKPSAPKATKTNDY